MSDRDRGDDRFDPRPDPITPVGPMPSDDDPTVRLLRRALNSEADMVQPSDDGLSRITEDIDEQERRPGWVPAVAALAAAAVIGVIAVVAFTGVGQDAAPPAATGSATVSSPEPTDPGEPTTQAGDEPTSIQPTTDPTTDATEEPAPTTSTTGEPPSGGTLDAVPVYWLGDTGTEIRLYREFRTVPDEGDDVTSALRAMLSGAPLDPDYANPWSPATTATVERGADGFTVNLSPDAFAGANVGSEAAAMAIQQLVHTVTAAAGANAPVTILVDGQPGYEAWGVLVLGEPQNRQAQIDVQAPVWIDTPVEGATVPAGAVTVSGVGTAFEANLNWDVTDSAGNVVDSGFTMAGANGEYAPFSFDVDLEPGTYTVAVFAPDESGGESPQGPRMFEDTKTITVQ